MSTGSALMVIEHPSADSDHEESSDDDEVEVKTLQSKYSEAQAQVKNKHTKAEVHLVMDVIVNADYC